MSEDIFKSIIDALNKGEQPTTPQTPAQNNTSKVQGLSMVTEGLSRNNFTKNEGLSVEISQKEKTEEK